MKLIITHEFDPYQDQDEIEILHNAVRNHCIIEDIIYQIINDNE